MKWRYLDQQLDKKAITNCWVPMQSINEARSRINGNYYHWILTNHQFKALFAQQWKLHLGLHTIYLKRIKFLYACLLARREILFSDDLLTHCFRLSASFFMKYFTAVHEPLLNTLWLLWMHSSHGPFPGSTPEVIRCPRWLRTALFSSFVHERLLCVPCHFLSLEILHGTTPNLLYHLLRSEIGSTKLMILFFFGGHQWGNGQVTWLRTAQYVKFKLDVECCMAMRLLLTIFNKPHV